MTSPAFILNVLSHPWYLHFSSFCIHPMIFFQYVPHFHVLYTEAPVISRIALCQGWRQEFSNVGADSSNEGAKMWYSGY